MTRSVPGVEPRGGSSKSALPNAVLRPVRDRNAFEATVEQLATSVRLGVFSFGQQLPPERELAETLGVSPSTIEREWVVARGWLYRALATGDHDEH